jgi:Cytochrome P450
MRPMAVIAATSTCEPCARGFAQRGVVSKALLHCLRKEFGSQIMHDTDCWPQPAAASWRHCGDRYAPFHISRSKRPDRRGAIGCTLTRVCCSLAVTRISPYRRRQRFCEKIWRWVRSSACVAGQYVICQRPTQTSSAMHTFPRVATSTVMDYSLKPGTVVIGSIYLTHRRKEIYPDPEQFKPARFLERRFSAYEYLPFGGGARR